MKMTELLPLKVYPVTLCYRHGYYNTKQLKCMSLEQCFININYTVNVYEELVQLSNHQKLHSSIYFIVFYYSSTPFFAEIAEYHSNL